MPGGGEEGGKKRMKFVSFITERQRKSDTEGEKNKCVYRRILSLSLSLSPSSLQPCLHLSHSQSYPLLVQCPSSTAQPQVHQRNTSELRKSLQEPAYVIQQCPVKREGEREREREREREKM